MSDSWQDAIVLITSSDPQNSQFGTGFVIARDAQSTSLLTCAHVVRDVGGSEHIAINGVQARVIVAYQDEHVDLAVLHVAESLNKPPLLLYVGGARGEPFRLAGFQEERVGERRYVIRPLAGTFGEQVGIQARGQTGRVKAWDIKITGTYSLQRGYSGSPVMDVRGRVFGVVSTRRGEGKLGVAVSIEMLEQVWPDMPVDLLRNTARLQRGNVRAAMGRMIDPTSLEHRVRSVLGRVFSQSAPSPQAQSPLEPESPSVVPVPAQQVQNPSGLATPPVSQPLKGVANPTDKEASPASLNPHPPTVGAKQMHVFSASNAPASSLPPMGGVKSPIQQPQPLTHRPRPKRRGGLGILVLVLIVVSIFVFVANVPGGPVKPSARSTPTISSADEQATVNVHAVRATVDTQATVSVRATTTVFAQRAGNPYGGRLLIADPMNEPGSAFQLETNDVCNFKRDGYHAYNMCSAGVSIPTRFALEITLTTSQSCGEIDLDFDGGDTTFSMGICQNGDYLLFGDHPNSSNVDVLGDQHGNASSMNTGTEQSNILAIVAEGGSITLYVNNTRIDSIPDDARQPGTLALWGTDSHIALLDTSDLTGEHGKDARYNNAYLWAL